jgi:hypothetical protein
MFGDVDMHDTATVMSQHDEYEQHPALDGRHGEKITGHDVFHGVSL